MFLMWLGEADHGAWPGERDLDHDSPGIAAGLPNAMAAVHLVNSGSLHTGVALFICVLVAAVTLRCGVRRTWAAQDPGQLRQTAVGNRLYGGQSSHLPLKLNMASVIPPSSLLQIILFPRRSWAGFGRRQSMRWLKDIADALRPGQPIYVILFASAIVFFCFFYTALVFNSRETAET